MRLAIMLEPELIDTVHRLSYIPYRNSFQDSCVPVSGRSPKRDVLRTLWYFPSIENKSLSLVHLVIRKPLSVLASLNVLSEPKRALSEPKMVFQGSLRRLRSQNIS